MSVQVIERTSDCNKEDKNSPKYDETTYFHLKVTKEDYNEILSMIQRIYKIREKGRELRAATGNIKRYRSPKQKVNIEITGITRELKINGKVIHTNFEPVSYTESN